MLLPLNPPDSRRQERPALKKMMMMMMMSVCFYTAPLMCNLTLVSHVFTQMFFVYPSVAQFSPCDLLLPPLVC